MGFFWSSSAAKPQEIGITNGGGPPQHVIVHDTVDVHSNVITILLLILCLIKIVKFAFFLKTKTHEWGKRQVEKARAARAAQSAKV